MMKYYIDQWNRIVSPENNNPHTFLHLIYGQGFKAIQNE